MDIFTAHNDTICAVATPIGEGGIGILRISGPDALAILEKVFRPQRPSVAFQSHRLTYGWIIDPASGERVDEVLATWMRGPQTYTREDVVEINSHSGYGVMDRVLQIVLASGARLAEPGEFTRRAFLSGRIDLSQAEAVIELIRSRSEESLKQAGRQLQGGVRSLVESWRETLLSLHAQLEAFIDFSDDLDEADPAEISAIIQTIDSSLLVPLRALSHRYDEGRVLREGITLVLTGKPNVGKSSLLNALVGRERAIVTPHPGTTRDIIEDTFILSGVTVRIMDTAGLRPGGDSIEALGMAKTRESVSGADLVLWLLDLSRPLDDEDDSVHESVAERSALLILNKADLPPCFDAEAVKQRYQLRDAAPMLSLSVLQPSDLVILRTMLKQALLDQPLRTSASEGVIPNLRQKQCLDQAAEHLEHALFLFRDQGFGELIGFELGQARQALESILGIEADEALLDRIFGDFCIGK
jgi:tRNA modification GTPase